MSSFNKAALLDGLAADVQKFQQATSQIEGYSTQLLNEQPAPGKWSVAQVLEHLNSYNRYYLPHMEAAIRSSGNKAGKGSSFNSGWLGDYFTRAMYSNVVSKNEITNKMKAPKDHTPVAQQDVRAVLTEFIAGEERLAAIIAKSAQLDLAGIKVPISISRWIKISLGDTLRFLIAHQERHFLQISNTLVAVEAGSMAGVGARLAM